jgi:arabinofuranosyltransferase
MPDAPTRAASRADAWTSFAIAALVSIAGALLAWLALDRPGPGIDDAYITLVYGRDLAEGHGFVYTPGFERVEGSTSLAWTFVVAAVCLFTRDPEKPLMLVALLLTTLSLACVCRALRTLTAEPNARPRPLFYAIALGWMLFHPGFWAWNVLSLMENPLWTLTIAFTLAELAHGVQAVERPARHGLRLAAVAVLGALTRPEWLCCFRRC